MFELDRTVTTTDRNPLGVKGVGEAGTIGSTPTLRNAVLDALLPLGVTDLDMPATSMRIWKLITRKREQEVSDEIRGASCGEETSLDLHSHLALLCRPLATSPLPRENFWSSALSKL